MLAKIAACSHGFTGGHAVFHAAARLEVIDGIDLKVIRVSGPFHYLQGGPFQNPNDVLVDDILPGKHVKAGDRIEILNNKFRVAGIVEPGKGARKFLQIGVMQELIGAQGKATLFYLKLDNPANADAVVDEIKKVPGMEKYVVTSMRLLSFHDDPSNYPGAVQVYQCSDCDFGDYRFHRDFPGHVHGGDGAHARDWNFEIAGSIEVLHCKRDFAGDGGVGDCRNHRWSRFQSGGRIGHRSPRSYDAVVVVTGGWILKAAGIAIVGAILGALYPAYKAAQKDPIDALAYE